MAEVFVGYGDSPQDTAVLLLSAAEEAEAHVDVVRSVEGGFYVPEEIAKAAGVDYKSEDEVVAEQVQAVQQPGEAPAKDDAPKPAAKKAAAKKAASKRTTKTAAKRAGK